MPLSRFICIASILCIAFIGATNCSENNPLTDSKSLLAPRVAHMPLNLANPYDSTGIYHNILVEHYRQYFSPGDTTVPLAKNAIYEGIDALTNADGSGLTLAERDSLKTLLDEIIASHGDYDWILDEIEAFESENTTEREENYIHQFAGAVRTATDSASLMDNLLAIENAMMQENWNTEEVIARMGLSVIKHSAYMWMTKTIEEDCCWKDMAACAADFRVWTWAYDKSCDEIAAGRLAAAVSQLIWDLEPCRSGWFTLWA